MRELRRKGSLLEEESDEDGNSDMHNNSSSLSPGVKAIAIDETKPSEDTPPSTNGT